MAAEDGASAGVRIEQGDVVSRKTEEAVGLAQLREVSYVEAKLGRGTLVTIETQGENAELIGVVNLAENK